METKSKFCDVCGIELKHPAQVNFSTNNFTGRISITLDKIAGAYADYCNNCARNILDVAKVEYGETGTTKLMPENGSKWKGFHAKD